MASMRICIQLWNVITLTFPQLDNDLVKPLLGHELAIIYIPKNTIHYNDAIMGPIASQITSFTIVLSTVYSDEDQRKHQSSPSLAFVWGHTNGQ